MAPLHQSAQTGRRRRRRHQSNSSAESRARSAADATSAALEHLKLAGATRQAKLRALLRDIGLNAAQRHQPGEKGKVFLGSGLIRATI